MNQHPYRDSIKRFRIFVYGIGLMLTLAFGTSLAQAQADPTTNSNIGLIEFSGTVQSLPGTGFVGSWTVAGRAVQVNPATEINQRQGAITVGAYVKIHGFFRPDNTLVAVEVESDPTGSGEAEIEFYGIVQSLPNGTLIGNWQVGPNQVVVTASTQIDQREGAVAVGRLVEVEGALTGNAQVTADKIKVEDRLQPPPPPAPGFPSVVEFFGTVQTIPSGTLGDWTVAGRTVSVTPATRVGGRNLTPAVGSYVKIEGFLRPDGTIAALEIRVEDQTWRGEAFIEFYGVIQALPSGGLIGDWTVSGRTVQVVATTRIDRDGGLPIVGRVVEVNGRLQANGSVTAFKIETKLGAGAPPPGPVPVGFFNIVEFYGTVQTISTPTVGDWTIAGRTVRVTPGTQIRQNPAVAVGSFVEVKGVWQPDGTVVAIVIKAEDNTQLGDGFIEFRGIVEDLPVSGLIGTWRVNRRTVTVDASTRVNQERGQVAVNRVVEIKGRLQSDNSVMAFDVEVKPNGFRPPLPPELPNFVIYSGTVESFPTGFVGDWMVSGRMIHVLAATRIDQRKAPVSVGGFVKIRGVLGADGVLTAGEVEVEVEAVENGRIEFSGIISSLPSGGLVGDWMVGPRTVHVFGTTVINQERGAIGVGRLVKVAGTLQNDNSINATRIESEPVAVNLAGKAVPATAGATKSVKTGVFRPSNGFIFLKNQNTTGFADVQFFYGTAGDVPVTGDWKGTGVRSIAIYRNGSFFIKFDNTPGFADVQFPFGAPGDIPLAGDWDGDGIDTVGVYRPSTAQFFLRNTNTPGSADLQFTYGTLGDVPVVGDWDGDGIDTVGAFRPTNGFVYIRNSNTAGFAENQFFYGQAGDRPVVGDWNGDGIDTIGIYRGNEFFLRNTNSSGFADLQFNLGTAGDTPISGNWNGLP
jgi:hypothetical protein